MGDPEWPSRVANELSGARSVDKVVQAGSIGAVNYYDGAAPPATIPRQLPPAPVWFIDRDDPLAELNGLLAAQELATAERRRLLITVISGLGGVGKTGLGVHWAHAVGARFDGGQLYADLGAVRHGGGVEVGDVLGGFLRALGVREEWIPGTLDERAALFRSRTADRRVLVFLDNAEQRAQVTPLLPGSADSVVIVTSRQRLTALRMDGARLLPLDPLETEDGVRLLRDMLGDTRVDEQAEAAAELVRLCGGLTIAVRVCGALLAGRRRHGVDRLVADLVDDRRRLGRLASDGVPIVEAVFDAAYRGLPPAAARLYRRLGLHPGPDFSPAVVAVAAERTEDEVADAIESLVEANLLEEVGADRYRFHDLVRLHARGLAGGDQADQADRAVARVIVEWYLDRAKAADRAVMGRRLRLADPAAAPPGERAFPGSAAALGWLETERTNLLAAVRTAAAERWDVLVWQFTEALWALYDNRVHHADEIEASRLGVESARRCGALAAEARMRNHVVRALLRAGEHAAATAEIAGALEAARAAGHRRVESAVIESSGFAWLAAGEHTAAIDAFRSARSINAELDNPRGVALQSYHIGIALNDAGRHGEAADELTGAMRTMVEISDELSQGKIGILLGRVCQALGRRAVATAALTSAATIMAARDMPRLEAEALELLADVTDDAEAAERHRRRARAIHAASGRARSGQARSGTPDP